MPHIVNLACGLANRMFQYSYYLYLRNNGYDVEVNAYESGKLPHEKVDWNRIFPSARFSRANKWKVWFMAGGNDLISRARRKFCPSLTAVMQMPTAFDAKLPDRKSKNCYIIGVFQNAVMVEAVSHDVYRSFAFSPLENDYNIALSKEIESCNAVGIHVRKGKDYQKEIWFKNTCPIEYYRTAVSVIKKAINNPRFFVFCDNKQWVKDNFRWLDYKLVEGNPCVGYGCHFDMQLMSRCKYNIISNSTYSWWGAYLNLNPNKIVILPKVWFNPSSCADYTSDKLACKGWI